MAQVHCPTRRFPLHRLLPPRHRHRRHHRRRRSPLWVLLALQEQAPLAWLLALLKSKILVVGGTVTVTVIVRTVSLGEG